LEDVSKTGWYTGTTIEEPCQVCTKGRVVDWLKENCGLSGLSLSRSLEGFNAAGTLSDKLPALNTAKLILSANESAHGIFTFYGDYGTGKTHLLMSIVNGFTSIGVRAVYSLASDILDDIRSGYQNKTSDFLSQYQGIRVLCIDELDKVSLTDWAKEALHKLIDHRYQQSDKYLTVFASNLSPFQYPDELHYLSSRMTGGEVVEVKGADMRPAVADDYTNH
jgi:DNA replication protein DnaC